MRTASRYRIVLVTAPSRTVARRLIKRVLEARLAACGNIVSGVESHYWWQGRMERGREVLILFKTRTTKIKPMEALISSHHPYDTPEFISVGILGGSARYLKWIDDAVRPA